MSSYVSWRTDALRSGARQGGISASHFFHDEAGASVAEGTFSWHRVPFDEAPATVVASYLEYCFPF